MTHIKLILVLISLGLIASCTAKPVRPSHPGGEVVTPPPGPTGQDVPIERPEPAPQTDKPATVELPPAPPPKQPKIDFPTRLNNLIKQLSDEDWNRREAASKEIQEIIDYYINGIAEDPEHLSPEMEYLVKALLYASEKGQPPGAETSPDVETQLRSRRLYPPIKYRLLVPRDIAKLYPKVFDNLCAGEDDKVVDWLNGQPKEIRTKALPLYREFLNSQNDVTRLEAIGQIGKLQDVISLKQILLLLQDGSPAIRKAAFDCVVKIGDETVVTDLFPLMKDTDADVRTAVAKSIFSLGGPDALVGPIVSGEPITNTTDGYEQSVLKEMVPLLSEENSTMVIEHSNMMFKLGKQAQGAVKDLLAMIQTGNDVSRSIAVVTLSEIGDKSCVKHILPLLDDSTTVRVWALYALGRLKDPAVIKDILPRLKDGDGDIREFAVFALDQIGDPAVVNHLMPLLKDSELVVRMRAIRAINKFGGFSNVKKHSILQELRPLLKELPNRAGGIAFQDFYDNGTEIIRTIAALNDTLSAKDIVPLLHQFYYVRAEAIMALGKLDKEAAVKHLVPLLVARDEGTLTNGKKINNEVREVAIKTLTQVGDPSVLKSLLPLLEDPDDEIKLYTAIAVSRFNDIRAIPVWIYLIDKYGVWHLSSYEDRVNYGWLAVTIDEVRGGYEFAREGLEKLAGEAAAKSRLFRDKKIDAKDYIEQAKQWKAWWADEGKAWYEQELKKLEEKK